MKLLTYFYENCYHLGVLGSDDKITNFKKAGVNYEDMNDFIINHNQNDLDKLKILSQKAGELELNLVKKCAPIISPKQDIICLGINYMEHAIESYKYKKIEFDGKREFPVYFSKRVSLANGDDEILPSHANLTNKLDYEVELAVILSKDAKNVSIGNTDDYIFGYTILNDISARDLQNQHKQWYFGKSLDNACPIGPWIVTKDELDISNLDIKSYVNGELRQNSNTSKMIFNASYVINDLSQGMTLKAGTIISLGTPSGVGMGFEPPKFLKSGDEIICEIQGIGKLRNLIS